MLVSIVLLCLCANLYFHEVKWRQRRGRGGRRRRRRDDMALTDGNTRGRTAWTNTRTSMTKKTRHTLTWTNRSELKTLGPKPVTLDGSSGIKLSDCWCAAHTHSLSHTRAWWCHRVGIMTYCSRPLICLETRGWRRLTAGGGSQLEEALWGKPGVFTCK